jgi:hypothetical protein
MRRQERPLHTPAAGQLAALSPEQLSTSSGSYEPSQTNLADRHRQRFVGASKLLPNLEKQKAHDLQRALSL